uniref:3-hydroxybutyrate dehydrogenase n=1 Tax=Arcella intermedia TaxID=1963864 RepID=A0A6B2LD07_9EUKA
MPVGGKVVMITGCDTGFGCETAKRMSEMGFQVIAGCLTRKGVEQFSEMKNIYALILDISKEESIEDAFSLIYKKYPGGIWALINNAGITDGLTLEFTTMETYRRVFEINLFGHILVTKRALPLIKKTKGRIINMSSISGRIPSADMSAYTASKHAMIGWTKSIAGDLGKFGIKVVSIQPTFMRTPIVMEVNKNIQNTIYQAPKDTFHEYGGETFAKDYEERLKKVTAIAQDPQQVVDAYINATISQYPKEDYVVGSVTSILIFLYNVLPWHHFVVMLKKLLG